MGNKIRDIFCPSEEKVAAYRAQRMLIFESLSKREGCETCAHCRRITEYPGFVTGEECECTVGLACDTVLFRVTHCPKYEKRIIEW